MKLAGVSRELHLWLNGKNIIKLKIRTKKHPYFLIT